MKKITMKLEYNEKMTREDFNEMNAKLIPTMLQKIERAYFINSIEYKYGTSVYPVVLAGCIIMTAFSLAEYIHFYFIFLFIPVFLLTILSIWYIEVRN